MSEEPFQSSSTYSNSVMRRVSNFVSSAVGGDGGGGGGVPSGKTNDNPENILQIQRLGSTDSSDSNDSTSPTPSSPPPDGMTTTLPSLQKLVAPSAASSFVITQPSPTEEVEKAVENPTRQRAAAPPSSSSRRTSGAHEITTPARRSKRTRTPSAKKKESIESERLLSSNRKTSSNKPRLSAIDTTPAALDPLDTSFSVERAILTSTSASIKEKKSRLNNRSSSRRFDGDPSVPIKTPSSIASTDTSFTVEQAILKPVPPQVEANLQQTISISIPDVASVLPTTATTTANSGNTLHLETIDASKEQKLSSELSPQSLMDLSAIRSVGPQQQQPSPSGELLNADILQTPTQAALGVGGNDDDLTWLSAATPTTYFGESPLTAYTPPPKRQTRVRTPFAKGTVHVDDIDEDNGTEAVTSAVLSNTKIAIGTKPPTDSQLKAARTPLVPPDAVDTNESNRARSKQGITKSSSSTTSQSSKTTTSSVREPFGKIGITSSARKRKTPSEETPVRRSARRLSLLSSSKAHASVVGTPSAATFKAKGDSEASKKSRRSTIASEAAKPPTGTNKSQNANSLTIESLSQFTIELPPDSSQTTRKRRSTRRASLGASNRMQDSPSVNSIDSNSSRRSTRRASLSAAARVTNNNNESPSVSSIGSSISKTSTSSRRRGSHRSNFAAVDGDKESLLSDLLESSSDLCDNDKKPTKKRTSSRRRASLSATASSSRPPRPLTTKDSLATLSLQQLSESFTDDEKPAKKPRSTRRTSLSVDTQTPSMEPLLCTKNGTKLSVSKNHAIPSIPPSSTQDKITGSSSKNNSRTSSFKLPPLPTTGLPSLPSKRNARRASIANATSAKISTVETATKREAKPSMVMLPPKQDGTLSTLKTSRELGSPAPKATTLEAAPSKVLLRRSPRRVSSKLKQPSVAESRPPPPKNENKLKMNLEVTSKLAHPPVPSNPLPSTQNTSIQNKLDANIEKAETSNTNSTRESNLQLKAQSRQQETDRSHENSSATQSTASVAPKCLHVETSNSSVGAAETPASSKRHARRKPATTMTPLGSHDNRLKGSTPTLKRHLFGESSSKPSAKPENEKSKIQAEMITKYASRMFGDADISNEACISARIFSTFALLNLKSISDYDGADGTVPTIVRPLMPLLKSLVHVEMTSLEEQDQTMNDQPRIRRVHFSGFDCSSMKPPVESLFGSDLHQRDSLDAMIIAAHHISSLADLHKGNDAENQQTSSSASVVHALETILRFLYGLDSELKAECAKSISAWYPLQRVSKAVQSYTNDFEAILRRASSSTKKLTPVDTLTNLEWRLSEFAGQSIRFHLRRLFNPPPLPFTKPTADSDEESEASIPPPPQTVRPLLQSCIFELVDLKAPENARDTAVADCSFSSLISLALSRIYDFFGAEKFKTAVSGEDPICLPNSFCTSPGSQRGLGVPEKAGKNIAMPPEDLKELIGDIEHVYNFLGAYKACKFLVELMQAPGVEDEVERLGGWSIVEYYAKVLLEQKLNAVCVEDAHFSVIGYSGTMKHFFAKTEDWLSHMEPKVALAEISITQVAKRYKTRITSPKQKRALFRKFPHVKEIAQAIEDGQSRSSTFPQVAPVSYSP